MTVSSGPSRLSDSSGSPLHATVRIPFLTGDEARRAAQALEPDNEGLLVSRIKGKELVLEARGTAMSVLRTLDDTLACLRALQDHP